MLPYEEMTIPKPLLSSLNLTTLPFQLQVELIDFYEFLIEKYNIVAKTENSLPNIKFKRFLDKPIQVAEIKKWSKDELHER